MISSIIIDDKQAVLHRLENQIIENCPDVSIEGKALTLEQAAILVDDKKPDLVFVNTLVENVSGFEIFKYAANHNPEIIYMSEEKQMVYDALKHCAVGFLHLPVEITDLVIAVTNAQRRISHKKEHRHNKQLLDGFLRQRMPKELIGIPTMEGYEFIPYREIVRCEGLQKCTRIVTVGNNDIVSAYNLGKFEKMLKPLGFFSPHRSYLINLSQIKKYHNEGTIMMADGSSVPVSRRKKTEFLSVLRRI